MRQTEQDQTEGRDSEAEKQIEAETELDQTVGQRL